MDILSIKQIREYIPNCTEIRACPNLPSCINKNMRICTESDKPCYIAFKKEELEGLIRIDFKHNIIAVHRLNEERDYAGFIRPNGSHVELDGTEPKEKIKKILDKMRKQKQ